MKFIIIGGDKRQLYLKNFLAASGNSVKTFGLTEQGGGELVLSDCDTVLLPMPVSRDGKTLNSPLYGGKMPLDRIAELTVKGQTVFGGIMPPQFCDMLNKKGVRYYDYGCDESLLIYNAALTAEAAVKTAVAESDGALFGSNSLIIGYGRIGKILSRYLSAVGSSVTVAVRKVPVLAEIAVGGYSPVKVCDMSRVLPQCDYVFNTAPAPVLGSRELKNIAEGAIVIDLASAPGGTDREAAEKLNIKVVSALSLPGKESPRAAAKIIYETVKNNLI